MFNWGSIFHTKEIIADNIYILFVIMQNWPAPFFWIALHRINKIASIIRKLSALWNCYIKVKVKFKGNCFGML